jgi:glycosyltransferase 2 family protein
VHSSDQPTSSFSIKKVLKLLLKVIVTILCFWYIATKIDFTASLQAIGKANWYYMTIAVLLYALSKIISSFRLNIYFRNIQLFLSEWENMKLYWLGMFYNLFLPGSIGGDAYKVVILKKRRNAPYKPAITATLLDRFSGLLGLGIILAGYSFLVVDNRIFNLFLLIGSVLSIGVTFLIIKRFFKVFLPGFWNTFFGGLAVQGIQVVCIYVIMLSLGIPVSNQWIFIFLLASVVSVFPISMGGGLGTRELVFAEGARYFHLDPHMGVTISLIFFLCNLLSCVWGAYFVFVDPLKPSTTVVNN